MPRNGYKTITIKEEAYAKLEKLAEKSFRTIPETVDFLIAEMEAK